MITLEVKLPKINAHYLADVEDELDFIMVQSAKKFVRAASSRIPKLSGQARGTLLNLAGFVGTQLVAGPDPRSIRAPRGQSFATGRAQSHYSVDWKHFEWGTTVPYFERHDSAEWEAVEVGLEAFVNEFEFLVSISTVLPNIFLEGI